MAYVKAQLTVPQIEDANGNPGVGYTISAYIWDTSTPTPMYTSSAGAGSATSFTFNSLGQPQTAGGTACDIFLDEALIYKFIIRDSLGSQVGPTIGPVGLSIGQSSTIAEAIAKNLSIGQVVTVYGYASLGDMPPATYIVVAGGTGTADGVLYHNMDSGRQLMLIHNGTIDIRQTGADITGVSVINTQWIAAMSALADGGELIIPANALCLVKETYRTALNMTDQLSVPYNNIRIRLDGELRAQTNDDDDYIVLLLGKRKGSTNNAADYVENISLMGAGIIRGDYSFHTGATGEGGHCLYIGNSKNVIVHGIGLTGGWGDGIYVDALPYGPVDSESNYNSLPINVVIDSVRSYQNRRNNLSILNVDGITVVNSKFNGADAAGAAPHAGIDIEPDYVDVANGFYCRGIRIIGNEIYDNYGSGLEIADTAAGMVNDVLIMGNKVMDCGDTNYGFGGIRAVSPDGTGSVRVIGNEVIECYGVGIDIDGASAGSTNGTGRVIVAHNYVRGTKVGLKSAANIAYGISARDGVIGVQIIGNLVELVNHHGIYVDGAGAACEDIMIANNQVFCSSQATDNTYDNIYIGANCTNVMAQGNTVRRTSTRFSTTNQPRYGINLVSDYCHALNNDCYIGGKTKNLECPFAVLIPDDTSRHGLVKNNFGYVNETVFRSAAFSVSGTGTGTLTIAHGLDTRSLDNATNARLILSQISCQAVSESVDNANFPVVYAMPHLIDATNLTVKYTIITAGGGSDTVRIACKVNPPMVR